jgi:hypothetical protein
MNTASDLAISHLLFSPQPDNRGWVMPAAPGIMLFPGQFQGVR